MFEILQMFAASSLASFGNQMVSSAHIGSFICFNFIRFDNQYDQSKICFSNLKAIVSLMTVLTQPLQSLCDLLFILSQTAIPSSVIHCRSYILLISKTLIFAAAANWTRLISYFVGNLFRIKSYIPSIDYFGA